MVRAILFLFFPFVIFAEIGAGMEFIIAGKKTVSEQKNNNSVESRINQETQNIGVAKIRMNDLKDNFGYYAEMQLLKSANGDDRRDYFYFGENAFLELFIPRIDLNIGRKLFSSGRSSFTGSRDGKEGISVKLDSGKKISLDFILFDYYRGFPLYEKNIILSRDESKTENGERSRHGIFFDYSLDKLRASAYTLYLNLGNWGEFSKDDYRRNSLGIGDGDFLYHAGTDISYEFSIFSAGFYFISARGLDKTQSNSVRQEKSLPISGELFGFKFSGKISRFEFKFDLFLPDSDKRNKQGEVIESGFIGMGSYPGNSVILSQGLNFYPSGWITPVGLEKRNSIETGRMNSARALSGISFHSGKSVFELNYDYLIPRTIAGESPGSISVQKRDYAKYFLSELSFIIRHGDRNRDNYYLGLIISKLLVPGNLHLSATAIIFQAGFFF